MQKFNQHRDNQYYKNLATWLNTPRTGENIFVSISNVLLDRKHILMLV